MLNINIIRNIKLLRRIYIRLYKLILMTIKNFLKKYDFLEIIIILNHIYGILQLT